MIESLHLRNFKCFEDQTIEFGPLVLLSGLNGQGKSSVLQALSLLRQSYQQGFISNNQDAGGSHSPPRLALNGDLVQLGTGQDVYFEGGPEKGNIDIEIEWTEGIIGRWSFAYQQQDDVLDFVSGEVPDLLPGGLFDNRFQYIQADRIGPRTVFETSNFQVRERNQLGARGEYTAHYLSIWAAQDIADSKMAYPHQDVPSSLKNQVEAWLSEISPGTRLDFIQHPGTDLISLQYSFVTGKLTSRSYRSTNVGFGITYTLPILVAVLSAHPGALILLENPEAHLHPKGQVKMGELIARAASCGIQIVVETHSDHVLNGIRLAVYSGILSPDDVCLHFFERREEDDNAHSKIISPQIDRNGRIDQWPDGFFDEWDKSLRSLLRPRSR